MVSVPELYLNNLFVLGKGGLVVPFRFAYFGKPHITLQLPCTRIADRVNPHKDTRGFRVEVFDDLFLGVAPPKGGLGFRV